MHIENGYRMELPEGCPKEVYEIMKSAWDEDPRVRPTFSEVKLHLESFRVSHGAAGKTHINHAK